MSAVFDIATIQLDDLETLRMIIASSDPHMRRDATSPSSLLSSCVVRNVKNLALNLRLHTKPSGTLDARSHQSKTQSWPGPISLKSSAGCPS